MQQAYDFRDESEALYQLIEPIKDEDYQRQSLFKDWTINDVLGHLHMWNWAADLSLKDSDGFAEFGKKLIADLAGSSLREFENNWLDGLKNKELLDEWRRFYLEMSERFAVAEPKKRVKWMGPDMSVLSSITARLMETWAHGQEVYDLLGVVRDNADRIKNIAVLGVNTFGWTYMVRSMDIPPKVPRVKLTAPSGAIWEWNESNADDSIEGAAQEFCQVVTQTRNIGDTKLQVKGEIATQWMSMAQCFAGGVEEPPAPGARFTA
ncbi:MAG: TIGR03084 family protein [Proteobacteria bacterium]|nr:TIGR03084 family protein [Pseudomonadota bacterium]